MGIETEQFKRSGVERREASYESKETRETEDSEELKAAAALERADYLVGEVKSTKKQMQNIVIHMQQVLAAIRDLRAQLQLQHKDDQGQLLEGDQKRVTVLQQKIQEYRDELLKMKDELVSGFVEQLKNSGSTISETAMRAEAQKMVEDMLQETNT